MFIYFKKLRNLAIKIGFVFLFIGLALCVLLSYLITPSTDEWSTEVNYKNTQIKVSIPAVIRLATSPLGGFVLNNRVFYTRFGTAYFEWNKVDKTLYMRCEPCLISILGTDLEKHPIEKLEISVQRFFNALNGTVTLFDSVQKSKILVQGDWTAILNQTGIMLDFKVAPTPIVNWYRALVPFMVELETAQIEGALGLSAQVALPQNSFKIVPEITNFKVQGLNTHTWLHAPNRCGVSTQLHSQSWLARSVVAAEDPRFFAHYGYDIKELNNNDRMNEAPQKSEFGMATLTQQLVRILITGNVHTVSHQLREILYVVEMDKTVGKNKILQLYLDNAAWGKNLCGVQAAASFYFGVKPEELSPVQAAWLAALLHNPEMELEKWRFQGEINRQRLMWVIHSMQGTPPIGYAQKNTWLHEAQIVNWPAPLLTDVQSVNLAP